MGLRDTFLNMLGVETPEVQKTDNSALRSARDFLSRGNRTPLYADWAEIKVPDSEMYSGYTYAVIQKRSNKVARLAKTNLKTYAKPEVVDEFQKRNETVYHPYLKLIEDSTEFTEKQFWKNISIYLDLAGRYYLGVIRSSIRPVDPKLPTITTDPVKFVMLNPYEIRRVIDKDKNVAGYIERKKDGRYREWPLHQIIEMRELNPFDPENGHWAMTDAAKEAVYTINQSGDYTRHSLSGNIDAPGIITTDVLLSDEDFANFRARVTQHTKGEPLFGNGSGAIKWDSMQVDLDKAALMDINEINRTTLFAVSGTSKTSLGIEQSGTTRETARVQSEQFVSDTAEPRLEDIVDFLNLDYKKYYNREYRKTGYCIEVESSISKDYDTEQKATALKQSQFQLAMQLMQAGYTKESAYQFAEGEIDFADLELEKGLDKPKNPEEPEEPEGNPTNPDNKPSGDGGNGNTDGETNNSLDLDLEPHSDLIENGGKGSGNFGHAGREGEVGGSAPKGVKAGTVRHQKYASGEGESQQVAEWEETNDPIYPDEIIVKSDEQIGHIVSSDSWSKARVAYAIRDKRVLNPFRDLDPNDELDKKDITTYREYMKATFKIDDKELDRLLDNTKNTNSVEGEKCDPLEVLEVEKGCTCEHDHKIETFINEVTQDDGKVVDKAYKDFLQEVRDIEKETIDASARKVEVNAFEISDIIGPRKRKTLTEKLKNAIHKYWWLIFPLFANNSIAKRNEEFSKNIKFIFNNELQAGVDDNALKVAEGHMETILNDILEASNRAYTNVLEEAAAEIIIKVYDDSPTKWEKYFEHKPTKAEALASIRRTDILEENRRIYERANTMAFEGYNRRDIVKAIRAEYKDISENRARLIARNETSRAFTRSQFEADRQFLNGVGKLEQAYKVWYSRRPANEQDKICDFCNEMIRSSEENPVPFESPFLAYGDSIEVVDNDGKLKIFTANYEDIDGGTLHPNCQCGYHLVFMNEQGEFVKTLNGGSGSGNFGHAGRPGEVGGSGKGPENMSSEGKVKLSSNEKARLVQELENMIGTDRDGTNHPYDDMDHTKEFKDYLRKSSAEFLVGLKNQLEQAKEDGVDISNLYFGFVNESGVYGRTTTFGKTAVLKFSKAFMRGVVDIQPIENYWTNPTTAGLIRHELGHLKAFQECLKHGIKDARERKIYLATLAEESLGSKIENIKESCKDRKQMSYYGGESDSVEEIFAESWANPNYSKTTKALSNALRQAEISEKGKEELDKYYSIRVNSLEKAVELCIGLTSDPKKFEMLCEENGTEVAKSLDGSQLKEMTNRTDNEDITILGEKETQNDASNSMDRNSVGGGIDNDFNNEQTTEVVNGGPGSGNFGHSGRPGEVGGSAPRGSIARPASKTVTAKWLSEHREFLKSQGYTDKWIDEQLEYLGQQKLKERATKAKTLEEFDEVLKEMEASSHDFSVWKKNVGDPARASLERKLELKSKVQNPEQQKAVDDLKATGIDLPKASEKWLRENCPQELVESITSSMKQAEKDGLDLSEVRLKMTETTTRGGSCTVDLDGTIKMFLNKNDYFDLERTTRRNYKLGPDGSKWWTNGKLDSCASHELGHALTWQVLKNQGMSPYRFKALCKEIVSLANDRFARESGEDYWASRGKLSSNNNNEYMSRYGGKNSGEVIAESHSNPSYSRYTQIVNEILIQSVKGEIKWT